MALGTSGVVELPFAGQWSAIAVGSRGEGSEGLPPFRSLSAGVRRSLGFPLCVSVKCAPVAQRTERVASDHQVAGSIPAGRAKLIGPSRTRYRSPSAVTRGHCHPASDPLPLAASEESRNA